MGLGPYRGYYWDLTIRDGTIVSATRGSPDPDLLSTQIDEPFRRWVTAEHPDDVAAMYEGSQWRISEESIPLFEQRAREYVEGRVGFIGLPPTGAQPSTPLPAEAVLDIEGCGARPAGVVEGMSSKLVVYADGRLVWRQDADLAQGANPLSTGLLEQRLTDEGVELMRSELLASGPLGTHDEECVAGGYHGHFYEGSAGLGFLDTAKNTSRGLADPWSWLPDSAWEDREITPSSRRTTRSS